MDKMQLVSTDYCLLGGCANMIIPTLFPLSINEVDLDNLMKIGFCYVKLPDENLAEKINTCIRTAREFFQFDAAKKEKFKLKEILNPGDRYQGYALRSQSKNTNAIEQIFFEPDAPFGPYEQHSAFIQEIDAAFRNYIFLPLINAIFKKLQLSDANFIQVTANPYCSIVFQSYPSIGNDKNIIRLNVHKDFGLLTVVFFEESGLEVKYQNEWQAIPAQKSCVVVNMGNALELMTGKRCHSALHRVINASDNRISMVYFYNPNYKRPVSNYVDNSMIASTGEQFFKQQFSEYYEVDH
jgi:isopenicillin N synthase-like dioxygenase